MRANGNHTSRRAAAGLLAVGLVFGLAACSDDEDEDEGATEATEATADPGDTEAGEAEEGEAEEGAGGGSGITISGFAFSEVTAAPGATVTVTNEDAAPHTVTADDEGAFEEVRVDGGSSGELTAPSEPGEYPFHCEIHRNMTGTLVVG